MVTLILIWNVVMSLLLIPAEGLNSEGRITNVLKISHLYYVPQYKINKFTLFGYPNFLK